MGIVAHDFLDLFLVFPGGLLDAGADNFHAAFLQRRHHRPGLDAAGDQQHPLALQALLVLGNALPGAGLFHFNQPFGACQ